MCTKLPHVFSGDGVARGGGWWTNFLDWRVRRVSRGRRFGRFEDSGELPTLGRLRFWCWGSPLRPRLHRDSRGDSLLTRTLSWISRRISLAGSPERRASVDLADSARDGMGRKSYRHRLLPLPFALSRCVHMRDRRLQGGKGPICAGDSVRNVR